MIPKFVFSLKTMALGFRKIYSPKFSSLASAVILMPVMKGPAWAWPLCAKRCKKWAELWGSARRSEKAVPFGLNCPPPIERTSGMESPDYTILLVEDEETDALLLKRAFKKNNLSNPVQWVKDG